MAPLQVLVDRAFPEPMRLAVAAVSEVVEFEKQAGPLLDQRTQRMVPAPDRRDYARRD